MNTPGPLAVKPGGNENDHWKFLRDVLVFQLELFFSNVHDSALMPVSLIMAVIDLIFKGRRQGALFYRVLRWAAHSEEMIDVYSAIKSDERPEVNPKYTIDAVIARLEGVLVRECEKGGRPRASDGDGPGDQSESKPRRANHETGRRRQSRA